MTRLLCLVKQLRVGRLGPSVLVSSAENTRINLGCPVPIVIASCYTLVTSGCLLCITLVAMLLALWLHTLLSIVRSSFLPSLMQRSMFGPARPITAVTCRSDALQQLSALKYLIVVPRTVSSWLILLPVTTRLCCRRRPPEHVTYPMAGWPSP